MKGKNSTVHKNLQFQRLSLPNKMVFLYRRCLADKDAQAYTVMGI
jgi:hypothetical protein